MLKYVAFMKVDRPARWTEWCCGPTAQLFTSPIEKEKSKVEQWLEEELKRYPDASVNERFENKKYFIQTTIIAFNVEKSSENAGALAIKKL